MHLPGPSPQPLTDSATSSALAAGDRGVVAELWDVSSHIAVTSLLAKRSAAFTVRFTGPGGVG
jgi:hypothetical protein